MHEYPTPQIGYYRAECCLCDLYKIEKKADLCATLERIEASDEVGPLMVFRTLAEAVECLADGNTPEERAEAFARLGWNGG